MGLGTRRATGVVILFLLFAGAAQAGTADDPEIQDATDVDGFPEIDVTAGWVQLDDDRIVLHLQLRDLGDSTTPLTRSTYVWTLLHETTEYRVEGVIESQPMGSREAYHLLDANGDRIATLSGATDRGQDRIRWNVPLHLIGDPGPGASLEHLSVRTRVDSRDEVAARDTAPDEGFGDAFAFPAAGGDGGPSSGSNPPTTSSGPGTATIVGLGGLILAAAGVVGYLGLRRGRARLRLSCPDPTRQAAPGQGTNFPVRLENVGGDAVTIDVETDDVPEDWVAFVPLPTVELEAGEGRELWVTVKPPPQAETGQTVEIGLTARTRDHRIETQRIELTTQVERSSPEAAV